MPEFDEQEAVALLVVAECCAAVRAARLADYRLNRLGIHPHSQVLHERERFLTLLQRIAYRRPGRNTMPPPDDDRDRALTRLVTALATEDTMTPDELDTVRAHFAELARLMLISGTIFAGMRREAMRLHNRAVGRINGTAPNPARQREREREKALLLPIEP
jgi:hypothetical protein